MKKIVLTTVLDFGLMPTSWAAEIVSIHEYVNNAQAPARQIQSAPIPSAVQGKTSRMAGMNQHEQAIITHETTNNSSAGAHQKIAENHQKTMGSIVVNDTRPSVSFTTMNRRERAVVTHEIMNSGQPGAYQAMAEACRHTISAD